MATITVFTARQFTETSFADLVANPVTGIVTNQDGSISITFEGDLTAREEWAVKIRASVAEGDAVMETLMLSLIDSFVDLRQIRNTTGTLTGAQLSNAVRALATAQVRMMRLTFGDSAGPAE